MILHVVSFSAESIIMIVLTEVMKKEEKKSINNQRIPNSVIS